MTIIFTVLILLYIICTIGAYNYIKLAYSKGGKYEILDIDESDLFCTFCPLFNIQSAIAYLVGSYKENNDTLNKFFKVDR